MNCSPGGLFHANMLMRSSAVDKKGMFLVAAAGIMWGFVGIFVTHLASMGVSTVGIVTLRMGGSALCVAAFIVLSELACGRSWDEIAGLFRCSPRDLALIAAMGFLGMGISNLCSYQAMQLVGVATSTVLLYTGPVFVGIASAFLYGELLDGQRCVAFVLNLLGSFLVVTNGDMSGISFDVFGIALGVFAAVINVVYVLGGKHLAGARDPRVVVCYAFLFAFIGLLPIGFPFRDVTRVAGLELASWSFVFCLLPSAVAYLLYMAGIATGLEAGKVSVLASLEVVSASLAGVLLLGDPLGAASVVGIVVVFLSVAAMNLNIAGKRASYTLGFLASIREEWVQANFKAKTARLYW